MKKIIFVRHGRAEDQTGEISDFERSLTPRGKEICNKMAALFKKKEKAPGILISSPAFRALETALIFAGVLGIRPEEVRMESSLYQADMNSLLAMLKNLGDDISTITLFGHNPAFTQFADRLSVEGCEFMTKTSVAGISFNVEKWPAIKPGTGKMEYFIKPDKNS